METFSSSGGNNYVGVQRVRGINKLDRFMARRAFSVNPMWEELGNSAQERVSANHIQ